MNQAIMQIDAIPDLYADAALVDAYDKLLFLSLWGRDTAIQEFLAGISLANEEGGINSFFLTTGKRESGEPLRKLVQIGESKRLNHHSGRIPASNAFGGEMAHLRVFDRLVTDPDLANRRTCTLLVPHFTLNLLFSPVSAQLYLQVSSLLLSWKIEVWYSVVLSLAPFKWVPSLLALLYRAQLYSYCQNVSHQKLHFLARLGDNTWGLLRTLGTPK